MGKVQTMSEKTTNLKSIHGNPLYMGSEGFQTPCRVKKMQKIKKLNSISTIVKIYSNMPKTVTLKFEQDSSINCGHHGLLF